MSIGLERAVEAPAIVRALRAYGITQVEIASAVGVSDRAVCGWSHSTVRPERYDRLAQLRELVVLLSDSLTARGVDQWLHARNRLLEGARPIDLLAEGSFDDVREAARAFVDGAYV